MSGRFAGLGLVLLLLSGAGLAAERKVLVDVDADELTSDTQVVPRGAGDHHVAVVWWIPDEFWGAVLARDATTAKADKEALLEVLAPVSLLAVVQADISPVGAFDYYSQAEMRKTLSVAHLGADGVSRGLPLLKELSPELESVLAVFRPILSAAMGELGSNLHFYVFSDRSPTAKRLVDPYRAGEIQVSLEKRDGTGMLAGIETPLNSLFVPRLCPNGKEAHVSWKYCPWSGTRLED